MYQETLSSSTHMATRLSEQELLWLRNLREQWLEQPLAKGQAHPRFQDWLNDQLTIYEAFEEYEDCEVIYRFIKYLNEK